MARRTLNNLIPQSPRAEQEQRKEKRKNQLSKEMGALAAIGVGVMGYKYMPQLTTAFNNINAARTIRLSRENQSGRFSGMISEALNLNKALDEIIDYSPNGLFRTYNRPGTSKAIGNRVAYLNEARERFGNPNFLEDVSKDAGSLLSKNHFQRQARVDTGIERLNRLYRSKDNILDSFGDKRFDAYQIIMENSQELFGENKKRLNKELDSGIFRMIQGYSDNVTKTIQLDFKDDDSKKNFMFQLAATVDAINNQTRKEAADFGKVGFGEIGQNIYAQKLTTLEMSNYASILERHRNNFNGELDAMAKNGFRPVTMQEAIDSAVRRDKDGKAFMEKITEGANRLQDNYGNKLKNNQFAEAYIRTGRNYGMNEAELGKHFFSKDLFVHEKTGELLNIGSQRRFREDLVNKFEKNFGIPFLNFNPISFMPGRKNRDIQRDMFAVLRGGVDIQSLVNLEEMAYPAELRNVNAKHNTLAKSYIFSNGSLIDTDLSQSISGATPEARFNQFTQAIKDYTLEGDYSLDNARSGLTSRYAQAVSGRTNRDNLNDRHPLLQALKLGGQEKESQWGRRKRLFNQAWFEEEELGAAHIETIRGSALYTDGRAYIDNLTQARNQLMASNTALDINAQIALNDKLTEAMNASNIILSDPIDMSRLSDDDYVLELATAIGNRTKERNNQPLDTDNMSANVRRNIENKMNQWMNKNYQFDTEEFLNTNRYTNDGSLFDSDRFMFMDDAGSNEVDRIDDIRMAIQQYAINEADARGISLTDNIYGDLGIDSKKVEEQLSGLRALNELTFFVQEAESNSYTRNVNAINFFDNYYQEGTKEYTNLAVALKDARPLTSLPYERGQNLLGQTRYIAIRNENDILGDIYQGLTAGGKTPEERDISIDIAKNIAKDILAPVYSTGRNIVGEILPFAARDANKTTLTRDIWFFADRMDSSLQKLGLGLPNENRGSFFDIIKNQYVYRGLGLFAAYEAAKYVDGLTGDFFSNSFANMYINMQLDMASAKEITGINAIGRRTNEIFPWLKQSNEWTSSQIINGATLGAFSEFRSREELEQYYVSGEDPIRKGRYWGIGSSGAWAGGRISYYRPNWYRRMRSDYMFTEDIYGSESEYWANHWLPTPTNPLAPLKHFVLDPYHYENKHQESRPYVLTGGFNVLNSIPLVGPVVDKTVSSVLKPTRVNPRFRESHEAYVQEENERIVSNYLGMNAGGTLRISGTGTVKLTSDSYQASFDRQLLQPNIQYLNGSWESIEQENDESGIEKSALDLLMDNIEAQQRGTTADGFVDVVALEEDAEDFILERDRYIASVYHGVPIDQVYMRGGNLSSSGMAGAVIMDPNDKRAKGKQIANYNIRQINQRLTDGRTRNRNDDPTQAQTLLSPNRPVYANQVIDPTLMFSTQGPIKDVQYRMTEFGGMYGFLGNQFPGVQDGRQSLVLESSSRFNNMADNFWDMNLGGLGGDFSEIFRRYFPRDTNKYYNPIRNTMPDWINYMFSINFFNCWELLLPMQGQSAA